MNTRYKVETGYKNETMIAYKTKAMIAYKNNIVIQLHKINYQEMSQ